MSVQILTTKTRPKSVTWRVIRFLENRLRSALSFIWEVSGFFELVFELICNILTAETSGSSYLTHLLKRSQVLVLFLLRPLDGPKRAYLIRIELDRANESKRKQIGFFPPFVVRTDLNSRWWRSLPPVWGTWAMAGWVECAGWRSNSWKIAHHENSQLLRANCLRGIPHASTRFPTIQKKWLKVPKRKNIQTSKERQKTTRNTKKTSFSTFKTSVSYAFLIREDFAKSSSCSHFIDCHRDPCTRPW